MGAWLMELRGHNQELGKKWITYPTHLTKQLTHQLLDMLVSAFFFQPDPISNFGRKAENIIKAK